MGSSPLTLYAGLYPRTEPHVKRRGHPEGFWKPSQRAAPDSHIFFWIHTCEVHHSWPQSFCMHVHTYL